MTMRSNLKHSFVLAVLFCLSVTVPAQLPDTLNGRYFQEFSVRLLELIHDKKNYSAELDQLARFNPDILSAALNTDDLRKAFWINLYNAAAQTALAKDSMLLVNERAAFSEKEIVVVAGKKLSLDFIVHRILRRSKNKYGLGYVNRLFITDYEKMFRVEYVDYRVHFSLNNGSASCSPIDLYRSETLNDQLNRNTIFYLHRECNYYDTTGTITLTKMMEWYKADFGGEKGMLQFLQKLLIIPANKKVKVRYRDYDWRLRLRYFFVGTGLLVDRLIS